MAFKIDPDAWYSEDELAQNEGRTVQAIRLDRYRGSGPPWTRHGRTVLYHGTEILNHYRSRQQRSTSDRPGGAAVQRAGAAS